MFRDRHRVAWTFHRNTSRWPFNMRALPDSPAPEASFKEYLRSPALSLPSPRPPDVALGRVLDARRSCRRFTDAGLTQLDLATLLATAYGVRGRLVLGDLEFLERPVPSGGGLYPLELYLLLQRGQALAPGIYHYAPLHHVLEPVRPLELPHVFIGDLFMGQPYAADAATIIVMTAVVERSLWKYGDRGYRYILLEAGHVAQNINLVAAAMGLGSLNLGGFFDSDLANLLGLDLEAQVPLYAVAVGWPASDDRTDLRLPAH
jgi:SagB-type dehydrogenase family enzyme